MPVFVRGVHQGNSFSAESVSRLRWRRDGSIMGAFLFFNCFMRSMWFWAGTAPFDRLVAPIPVTGKRSGHSELGEKPKQTD
jgi:hypothetical protein